MLETLLLKASANAGKKEMANNGSLIESYTKKKRKKRKKQEHLKQSCLFF